MPPDEFQDDSNPELEGILRQEMDNGEKLDGVEANTEGSLSKLDEIEKNTEAQIVQEKRNGDSLQEIAQNTLQPDVMRVTLVDEVEEPSDEQSKTLRDILRGPKGDTPKKGQDYFTKDEVEEFLDKATPVKGKDYFTAKEVSDFLKKVTPVKGKDYKDGVDGKDGKDGKSIVGPKGDKGDSPFKLYTSEQSPRNPRKGDLWYQN